MQVLCARSKLSFMNKGCRQRGFIVTCAVAKKIPFTNDSIGVERRSGHLLLPEFVKSGVLFQTEIQEEPDTTNAGEREPLVIEPIVNLHYEDLQRKSVLDTLV